MKIDWDKIKASWEVRALRWVLKAMFYCFLLAYVTVGFAFTYNWSLVSWQRSHPVETLYERVSAARAGGDLGEAIKIVSSRPQSESQTIVEQLVPHAAEFEPGLFFEISRRYVILDNPPEAIFWAQLGRLRMRFDFLRCNNVLSKELSDKLVGFAVPPMVTAYLKIYPEDLMPALKRVLEWDEKNPPPPTTLFDCELVKNLSPDTAGEPLPAEKWDSIRAALRLTAQKFLDGEMEEGK